MTRVPKHRRLTTKVPNQTDEDAAYELLTEAITEDGKGRDYYKDTGQLLWKPDPDSFTYWWKSNDFTYSMTALPPEGGQIRAYCRKSKTVVTHNGYERMRVRKEGWE